MEAIYSSEMSVDFQWTIRLYNPEDRNIHNDRWEDLKYYEAFQISVQFSF
jgi:hypothetical protein